MKDERLAFVGGGRITRILLAGWKRADRWPQDVAVLEPDGNAAERLRAAFPLVRICTAPDELARGATVLFLAVHPPHLLQATEAVAGFLAAGTLVVSLAPKIIAAQLEARLPTECRSGRVIPNAASLVGQGFNPFALGRNWSDVDRDRLLQLLNPLGESPEVPEDQLEAYAILTAMGPTYFWFQWQLLEELGQEMGLPPDAVRHGLDVMLRGATRTYFDSGASPQEIQDLIPVQPLREYAAAISQAYRGALPALYQKIKPQSP